MVIESSCFQMSFQWWKLFLHRALQRPQTSQGEMLYLTGRGRPGPRLTDVPLRDLSLTFKTLKTIYPA